MKMRVKYVRLKKNKKKYTWRD